MRKVSLLLILTSFVACNSDKEAKVQSMATKDTSTVQPVNYPPFDNSIKFEFADPSVAAGMFEVYKGWEDNNMELMKTFCRHGNHRCRGRDRNLRKQG